MGKKLKLNVRNSIVDFLVRTAKFVENSQPTDENQVKFRLEKLEVKWNEFEQIQDDIEGAEECEANLEEHRKVRAEFEEKYFQVRAGLVSKLPQLQQHATHDTTTTATTTEASSVHSYVRLPQINLPEFDGNYENWLPFHDTFKALIDSSAELGQIQKFHYLRASLKGDALKLIDSYPMSEANYRVAWEGLVARFSNNYLLKKRHINALLEYPKLKRESAVGIHDIIDCFERNTKILDQLGEKTSGWGAMLTHLMVSKLDDTTQKHWEEHAALEDDPDFSYLIVFLKMQTRVLDAVSVDQHTSSASGFNSSNGAKPRPTKISVNSAMEYTGPNCIVCNEQHPITRCSTFINLPLDERMQFTNAKHLCSNCLGRHHLVRDCLSKYRCRTCSKKHNSLLHPGFPGTGTSSNLAACLDDSSEAHLAAGSGLDLGCSVTSSVASVSSNVMIGHKESHVFLLTVLLKVKDRWGRTHFARALLDCGSQANLMSESLCQLLKLPRRHKKVEICGIGRSRRQTAHEVSATIASRVQDFCLSMDFLVLGQVTDDQPSRSLPMAHWQPPPGIALADPKFYVSGPIDIVLGSQFFYSFHLLDGGRMQIRKFDDMLPVFVDTVFGWVAAGETEWEGVSNKISCNIATTEMLDKTIAKFWTIEELSEKKTRSQEEVDCETHFQNTITRDQTGRYVARYPKRMKFHEMIGESKTAALRRFYQLERRLDKNVELRKQYNEFMDEYNQMGHMKLLTELNTHEQDSKPACYLPHHPVFKESSSTTKVRVVFDGSAKTTSNYSLNEALLTGPLLQDEILDLILRFRKHAVALVADVEKMYRQIRIHAEDTPLQRILWRPNILEPIKVYELQTVTYGLSPSSFIATRVLQQLALDAGCKYKLAATAVTNDFYMDDFLSGAESIEMAMKLRNEVQSLMKEGGFQLRKWSSNRPEVLADLPPESLAEQSTLHLETDQKVKTLGIVWETGLDQLGIHVQSTGFNGTWTKRKIFSAIAQLYDPLGLVSPVITWAKIRMQHLWLVPNDWDDPVPQEVGVKWYEFYDQLPQMQRFRAPRFVFQPDSSDIQLHVFCDASEAAYGACIYARSISKDGNIKVELIASKSRVAPLKRLSLPRLELCAALLGAKLYHRVAAALKIEGIPCWFWSDSTVTLHWIAAPPNTWQTFIGNRTSEIQILTHGHPWNHVKGSDNPADYISRGMLPKDFIENTVWRCGPIWLSNTEEKWPKHSTFELPPEAVLERRKTVTIVQNVEMDPLYTRFSFFERLVRVVAYMLRFVNRCRSKTRPNLETYLTVADLKEAKEVIVKGVQQKVFAEDIKELSKHRFVQPRSSLKLLSPFLDQNGILRVGGRLKLSDESFQTKHPMLIPNNHPLSRLIAERFHYSSYHSGPRMTLASIRQEFWPISGRQLANLVCRKCLTCFRHNPVPVSQPVGQLPTPRTTPSRPFSITGIDYCGPFYLKPVHKRAAPRKAFIAVFVCFATKATHLELVCDLSTKAFIAALRRFIARRGLPAEIHSDNGTNFRGARNTLNEVYHLFNSKKNQEEIINECSSRQIVWKFIPPRAPHFGGLWEAAVKTAKTSLAKTLGNIQLEYEDFATILTQIEANMNTRPLTPLSEDPVELDVLTPGHFVVGSSLQAIPDPDYTQIPMNRLKHYQQLQQMVQNHWERWRREYLTELNNQRKKSRAPADVFVGQMVLLQEENKPSIAWPLARITAVHPGTDDVVRVVTVRTSSAEYTRPTSRIYPLPFNRELVTTAERDEAAPE